MDFRHEDKYILNTSYRTLDQRLENLFKKDEHENGLGYYLVSSMYFDNNYDKCLMEKINGVDDREKFRIRYYNDDLSFIKLEKKIKRNGLCGKVSCNISKEEYDRILKNDIQWLITCDNRVLLQEFYIKMRTQLLRPVILIEYERRAYRTNCGDVRITIDTNIKSKVINTRNSGEFGKLGLSNEILEVKYKEFLPDIVSNIVKNKKRTSYSKYGACRLAWGVRT